MPRPHSTDPRIQLQDNFVKLKVVVNDLYYDLSSIYAYQLKRLEAYKENHDYQRILNLKQYADEYSKNKHIPYASNRVYIVSSYWHITLMLENADSFVIENFKDFFEDNRGIEIEEFYHIPPDYISTLFIFEQDELTFIADVRDCKLAEILTCFYDKNNLVSKEDGNNCWYKEPKRRFN